MNIRQSVIALLFIGGGLGAPSFSHGSSEPPQAEIDLLNDLRFRQSPAEEAAERATEGWPDCQGGAADICASWSDTDFHFTLVAVRSEEGATPVIESRVPAKALDGRVVIYLTGGPMGPLISSKRDFRTSLFEDFYASGFTVASVGYWGTKFRTLGVRNEIVYAGEDLARVYEHYKSDCKCEPAILATSFGGGVALYALREEKISRSASVFLLSPVLPGLDYASRISKDKSTLMEREIASKRAYKYRLGIDGEVTFVGPMLVRSFQFNENFSPDFRSDYKRHYFQSPCSIAMIGENDFRNSGFSESVDPKIISIKGAGHNLHEQALSKVKEEFRKFIYCHITKKS